MPRTSPRSARYPTAKDFRAGDRSKRAPPETIPEIEEQELDETPKSSSVSYFEFKLHVLQTLKTNESCSFCMLKGEYLSAPKAGLFIDHLVKNNAVKASRIEDTPGVYVFAENRWEEYLYNLRNETEFFKIAVDVVLENVEAVDTEKYGMLKKIVDVYNYGMSREAIKEMPSTSFFIFAPNVSSIVTNYFFDVYVPQHAVPGTFGIRTDKMFRNPVEATRYLAEINTK